MTATLATATLTLLASLGGARVCTSFAAYVVAFLLSRALCESGVAPVLAYQLVVIAALIDGSVLWSQLRGVARPAETEVETAAPVELKLAS